MNTILAIIFTYRLLILRDLGMAMLFMPYLSVYFMILEIKDIFI